MRIGMKEQVMGYHQCVLPTQDDLSQTRAE